MLLESGAARDHGMLYFDARLAVEHPTVEIRVCDVCTDPRQSIAVAVLIRALVETAARDWADGRPVPRWRSEALRACSVAGIEVRHLGHPRPPARARGCARRARCSRR